MRRRLACCALAACVVWPVLMQGQQRTAIMGVRVTVMRSCAIDSNAVAQTGSVTCPTTGAPPARTSVSTVSAPPPVTTTTNPTTVGNQNQPVPGQPTPPPGVAPTQTTSQPGQISQQTLVLPGAPAPTAFPAADPSAAAQGAPAAADNAAAADAAPADADPAPGAEPTGPVLDGQLAESGPDVLTITYDVVTVNF